MLDAGYLSMCMWRLMNARNEDQTRAPEKNVKSC